MTVLTDMPDMQIYTANGLKDEQGKDGAVYGRRGAVCLETQFRPNAINSTDPVIRRGCILKAGEEFLSYSWEMGIGVYVFPDESVNIQ